MNKPIWEQNFLDRNADLKLWNIRLGNDLLDNEGNPIDPGWGNGEQQYYTDHSSNLYIDEFGLNLCARSESIEKDGRNFAYTSARLDTKDHFSFCYGKLVVRAKLPVGQGYGLPSGCFRRNRLTVLGQLPARLISWKRKAACLSKYPEHCTTERIGNIKSSRSSRTILKAELLMNSMIMHWNGMLVRFDGW